MLIDLFQFSVVAVEKDVVIMVLSFEDQGGCPILSMCPQACRIRESIKVTDAPPIDLVELVLVIQPHDPELPIVVDDGVLRVGSVELLYRRLRVHVPEAVAVHRE